MCSLPYTVLSVLVRCLLASLDPPDEKNRPDTPMPTSRHCGNCGNRHAAPTGKRCAVVVARSLQPEETSNLCEDEIQNDLGNHTSSSPLSSPVPLQGKQDFTTPANIPGSMNLLAEGTTPQGNVKYEI